MSGRGTSGPASRSKAGRCGPGGEATTAIIAANCTAYFTPLCGVRVMRRLPLGQRPLAMRDWVRPVVAPNITTYQAQARPGGGVDSVFACTSTPSALPFLTGPSRPHRRCGSPAPPLRRAASGWIGVPARPECHGRRSRLALISKRRPRRQCSKPTEGRCGSCSSSAPIVAMPWPKAPRPDRMHLHQITKYPGRNMRWRLARRKGTPPGLA